MWGSVIGVILAGAPAAEPFERTAAPVPAARPAARFAARNLDQLPIVEQSAGKPWSITRSRGVLCFEVRQGERRQHPSERDRPIERSEIAVRERLRFGADYRVRYDFMVPPGPRSTAPWANIAQVHSTPDPFDAKGIGPVFAVQFNRERMRIVARADSSLRSDTRPQDRWLYTDETDLARGRWYRMEFDLRFDPGGGGRAVVRRDGRVLVNYAGAVGYRDLIGPYWKLGIYRRTAPEPLTVCYRGFTIAEGAASGR
jgi:hypothetical protein